MLKVKKNADIICYKLMWNSMKFSGMMCFEIILKITKNQGFTLSLEDTFFEKRTGQFDPPSPGILGSMKITLVISIWEMHRDH